MKKQVKKFMSALLACVMVVVSVIAFDMNPVHAASGAITEASGWLETAYVKWTPVTGATGYNVYVKSASASDSAYVQLDDELIRKYPSYMRADAVGLKAGDYVMKIVPLNNGKENTAAAIVSDKLTVKAHDRSGFTFSSNSPVKNGVGAYNNDGTLKSDASVLYVTEANKNTVKLTIGNTEYTGVAAITQAIKSKNNCQPVAIRIIGQVTLSGLACKDVSSAYAIGVKGASNVTFEGIGDDATLYEAGVAVFQSTGIEVRNLGLMNWGGGGDGDGISLKQSVGVWVHNNDVFYGNAGSDGDQAKGDGSMDLKDNSQYVTVSYNHFWDSGKMSLCGMKSESGENWITYHHNWFDHSDSRHPRIRTMSVHVYNNYYDGNSKYGVGAAKDSEAFVEANYFRNCNYPMLSSMQGSDVLAGGIFSGENGGVIKAYNNYMEGQKSVIYANSDAGTTTASATDFDAYLATSRSETVPSTYKAKQGGKTYSNFDTKVDLGVDTADIDAPADVPSIVTKYAGRIMGGDFKWTFDNSVDDTSHSLNKPLKDKLNAYKTSLVSVGGGSVSSGEKHIHNYVSTITKKATCAEEGEITYTCTATNGTCDKKTYTEVVPKTAHTYGEWTVVKAATATETGVKSRTCTVCKNNETAVIPVIGGEEPDTPVTDDSYTKDFSNGLTSDFFTITGSTSDSKGSVTYNGVTYDKCLKMEGKTNITFKAPSKGKLTLVFGGTTAASGKTVNVNGTAATVGTDNIVTVDVVAGNVTVTKGDAINLFYMVYTPSGTSETTHTHKYESKITKQATCTEAGVLTYTCTSTTGTCDKKTYTETIPAKGHSFSTEWTVDVEATETTPGSKSHHCTVCDAKTDVTEIPATGVVEKKNGLYYENGAYAYYTDGAINYGYRDFAEYEGKWYYVTEGTVDISYVGLRVNSLGTWYYVKNGYINSDYTGLMTHEDGRVFYVTSGVFDGERTGFFNYNDKWYYAEKGCVDKSYAGFVQNNDGNWYYVENGYIQTGYTGVAKHTDGSLLYVKDGMYDNTYTEFAQYDGKWYCMEYGCVIDLTYEGLKVNSLGTWYYVKNGYINSDYTGLMTHEDGRVFYVTKGVFDGERTGFFNYNDKWYYAEEGCVDKSYAGLRENIDGKLYYVSNGYIDETFNGEVLYNGTKYTVVNGTVK